MDTIGLFIDSDNKVANDAFSIFYDESKYIEDALIRQILREINYDAFSLVSGFTLEKLFISATSSNSVFYRFSIAGYDLEFMWEIFPNFDGDQNSGATLHVYKGSKRIKSYSGSLEETFNAIITMTFNEEITTTNGLSFSELPEFNLLLPEYA